jgi:hypothetical protein
VLRICFIVTVRLGFIMTIVEGPTRDVKFFYLIDWVSGARSFQMSNSKFAYALQLDEL